jgi:hypothetical protein
MQQIPDQLRDYINVVLIPAFALFPTDLDVLTKTNTTPYTPTSDYHPSTKLYVDAIAAAFVLGSLSPNSVTNIMLNSDIKVGSLGDLATDDNTDLVTAINEIVANFLKKTGGVLSGAVDFVDNELQRPLIKDYSEKGTILTGQSGTVNLNLALGNNFSIAPTGPVTITLSNWNASGTFHGFTIEIVQPASPQAITFPASFKFPNNVAPNVSQASKVSVISGYSRDGGTTVRVNASTNMNV